MAINSLPTSQLGAGITSAELYARVSKSLLSQNGTVKQLEKDITRDQTRLSGLGQLAGMLDDFKAVAESLAGTGLKTAATSSAANVLTAYTSGTATVGAHTIDVQQLAQAQTLMTRAVSDKAAPLGTGAATKITVSAGGSSQTIAIDATNNTLDGIASAFKAAGIDAQVVRAGSGYALSLTSETGLKNKLSISVDGDAALANVLQLTQTRAAQDAVLTIDGKQVTSADNDVTGALPGVALALKATGKTTVTVSQASSQIPQNVKLFVDAFNGLSDKLTALQKGDLKADPTLQQVQSQLAQIVGGTGGDALAKAGVTLRGGVLKIDEARLKAAIAADPDGTAKLFTDSGNGVADKLATKIAQLTGASGLLDKQVDSVGADLKTLTAKKSSITQAVTAQAAQLVQQYANAAGGTGGTGGLTGYTGRTSLFDFFA
ncbi:flagellar hook 2 domain-containing protein [Massilia arenosa]|uniref:Flagellar hook-associated protein 2 n=1 Tax=Zemynaea arenosa TaxID=2561931 RepID=A0A4Y9SK41_9BURK|nr:flagellar filament capping protein FliD [Massilia arenosa]TFW21562.1 flagellar hook 2 domain-containing protein [Massilia arenosa]